MIFLYVLILIIGFLFLTKGADAFVDGASALADRFGISPLVIGLTVVAFGTSAPELVVNVISAVQGNVDMALGNIIGSNIANILLVLGAASFFATIPVKSGTVEKEIPFMLLASLVLILLSLDQYVEGSLVALISRMDGLVLLTFFVVFLYYLFLSAKNRKIQDSDTPKLTLNIALAFTVVGLGVLMIGGKLVVLGAIEIASALHITQSVIGISIVALGTSLPELMSSIVAARKGKVDLAFGTVVGSNIFNILLILGITSTITPITLSSNSLFDLLTCLIISVALSIVVILSKEVFEGETRRVINRSIGFAFIVSYLAYIAYIFVRR